MNKLAQARKFYKKSKFWNRRSIILFILCSCCMGVLLYRFIHGLEEVTNLSDSYPFGIWAGFNVAGSIAIASGGFVCAALVYVLQQRQYKHIFEATLLFSLLAFLVAILSIITDLGLWYKSWLTLIPLFWNTNSVFAVFTVCFVCVLILTYLIINFLFHTHKTKPGKSRLAKFHDRLAKHVKKYIIAYVLLFITASAYHQTLIGGSMILAQYKMHPFWYTPSLPVLFLLSSVAVGIPVILLVLFFITKMFKWDESSVSLQNMVKIFTFFILIYTIARISDLTFRNSWHKILYFDYYTLWFTLEIIPGLLTPIILLFIYLKTPSRNVLIIACSLYVVFGVILHRINTFFIAMMDAYGGTIYGPSPGEIVISLGFIALFVLLYRAVLTYYPFARTIS